MYKIKNKPIFMLCITLLMCGCSSLKNSNLQNKERVFAVAHRGCALEGVIPENSLAALEYAHRYGYRAVECDPKYTRDSVLVLQHDRSINRCMHYADGYAPIPDKTYVDELDFKELRENYVLSSSEVSQRVPVPTLHEFLQACRDLQILPMIHSDVYEILRVACEETDGNFIAFGTNYEALKRIRALSDCLILWDPGKTPAEEAVRMLQQIGGRCGVSSMKRELLTADYIRTLHAAGYVVQSSIFSAPHEMQCIADGADIILSDFHLTAPAKTRTWKTQRLGHRSLQQGDSLSFSFVPLEHGSLEMTLEFRGEIDVVINNKYVYHLQNLTDSYMIRNGGWRFSGQAAEVRISACSDADIRSLQLQLYKY